MSNLDKTGLSPRQIKLAQRLVDPEFQGTVCDLVKEIGVSRATYYNWFGNNEFKRYVNELIDRYTDSELSKVWKALMYKIEMGDIQAIKLYFEIKGKGQTKEPNGKLASLIAGLIDNG